MKNKLLIFLPLILVLLTSTLTNDKKLVCRNGFISFFSTTPIEDIKAENRKVVSTLNPKTGDLSISLLMKSFKFPKAKMEEHFNENFAESNKYPKSNFEGKILDISKVNFENDGEYPVNIKGKLTIKDVTKEIETTGTISVKGAVATGKTEFIIRPEDYNFEIPKVVRNNIAETVLVTAILDYK